MSKSRVASYPLQECCICFDYMDNYNKILTFNCNHSFHSKCIYDWCKVNNNITKTLYNYVVVNGLCPLCKSPFINSINYNILINNNNDNNDNVKKCCCMIQ